MTTEKNSGGPPPIVAMTAAEPAHHSAAARLRNYFLTGLVLVGPIYITLNLTWWFINWVDDAMPEYPDPAQGV